MVTADDLRLMRQAIELARRNPERPFGVVIACGDAVLAEGENRHDESAIWHAETDAIHKLDAVSPGDDRAGVTLYTTAEPCPMCQAAILFAGIPRVVYGASIPFLVSQGWWQIDLRADDLVQRAPERACEILGDVLGEECRALFAPRR